LFIASPYKHIYYLSKADESEVLLVALFVGHAQSRINLRILLRYRQMNCVKKQNFAYGTSKQAIYARLSV